MKVEVKAGDYRLKSSTFSHYILNFRTKNNNPESSYLDTKTSSVVIKEGEVFPRNVIRYELLFYHMMR